jgi:hypothetical protein
MYKIKLAGPKSFAEMERDKKYKSVIVDTPLSPLQGYVLNETIYISRSTTILMIGSSRITDQDLTDFTNFLEKKLAQTQKLKRKLYIAPEDEA